MREYIVRVLLRGDEHNENIESKLMLYIPEFVMIKGVVFQIEDIGPELDDKQLGITDSREEQSRTNLRLFPKTIVFNESRSGALYALRNYEHSIRSGKYQIRDYTVAELKIIEEKLKRFRRLWGYELAVDYNPEDVLYWDKFSEELC